MLILVAALAIAWYAIHRLFVPEPLQPLGVGLVLLLETMIINGAVAFLLLYTARAYHSIILEADGRHLLTDVWTSTGVLLGLGLVWLTDVKVLDPIIALVVAGNILWTAVDLIRRSFNGLMDHALPPEEQAVVRTAIESHLGPQMDYHALRTRQAGSRRFVDFHLLVPGQLTVQRAHALTGRIEGAVRAALPGVEVTVHIEPIEEQAAWEDSALLPLERARRHQENRG
jgi:cation diffusion facilitator family transporter